MKIIMVVAGLLLLSGAGAGAYFFFLSPAEAAVGEAAEHAPPADHSSQATNSVFTEFVELDPLILPIVDKDGVSQMVSLVISLEVPGVNEAERVRIMRPKLQDAYIQDMYGVLGDKATLKGGVIQVGEIKERLTRISKSVLGDDGVNGVMLQVVQQRPI